MADQIPTAIDKPATLDRLSYKPNEAAAVIGISRNRVFEMLKSGDLASVKYGRTRLISRRAIEQFLGTEAA